jgi:hypothetical protein
MKYFQVGLTVLVVMIVVANSDLASDTRPETRQQVTFPFLILAQTEQSIDMLIIILLT